MSCHPVTGPDLTTADPAAPVAPLDRREAAEGRRREQAERSARALDHAAAEHLARNRGSRWGIDGRDLAEGLRVGDPLAELVRRYPEGPVGFFPSSGRSYAVILESSRPGEPLRQFRVDLTDGQVVRTSSVTDSSEPNLVSVAPMRWGEVMRRLDRLESETVTRRSQ